VLFLKLAEEWKKDVKKRKDCKEKELKRDKKDRNNIPSK
jgi:hypothetical protein